MKFLATALVLIVSLTRADHGRRVLVQAAQEKDRLQTEFSTEQLLRKRVAAELQVKNLACSRGCFASGQVLICTSADAASRLVSF